MTESVYDIFLNCILKNKTPVIVFLINGIKLDGMISSFDNSCLLLKREGQSLLVFKHGISTIMPQEPIQLS